MTNNEKVNLVEGLRAIDFSNAQINDFILMLAGRISIAEWKDRYEKEQEKNS